MEKNKKSSRGRTSEGLPNPIDIHVGERVRLRRQMLKMSQEKLASLMGLTFQQVQKYERGMNRIGASRLWDLSKILEVEISYFYGDMPAATSLQSPRKLAAAQSDIEDFFVEEEIYDPMTDKGILEMVTAFSNIKNKDVQFHLRQLILLSARSTPYPQTKEEAA